MSSVFSFPLNLCLLAACLLLLWVVESEGGSRRIVRSLRSLTVSCWLLGILVVWCVVGGLVPPWWAADGTVWEMLGFQFFPATWGFQLLLFLLLSHLALVVIHRLRKGQFRHNAPFLLVHLGLLTALTGGLLGVADRVEGRAIVSREAECRTMFLRDGRVVPLGFGMHLTDFSIERNERDGSVAQFSAVIGIDSTAHATLAVNHPYAIGWATDLYLNSYDVRHGGQGGAVEYVVVQIVREPGKYAVLAGILQLAAGIVWLVCKGRTPYVYK